MRRLLIAACVDVTTGGILAALFRLPEDEELVYRALEKLPKKRSFLLLSALPSCQAVVIERP